MRTLISEALLSTSCIWLIGLRPTEFHNFFHETWPEGVSPISRFELTLAWLVDARGINLKQSSSTVSGGGLMLSNSNEAATLGGRIDPITTEVIITTSAIINLEEFDL